MPILKLKRGSVSKPPVTVASQLSLLPPNYRLNEMVVAASQPSWDSLVRHATKANGHPLVLLHISNQWQGSPLMIFAAVRMYMAIQT